MSTECITPTLDTSREPLPAVKCAPWCEDGTGHTDALFLEDQWCSSEETFVRLTRQPMVKLEDEQGKPYLAVSRLGVYVGNHRDALPYIAVEHNGDTEVKLSPDEALELAAVLTMYAQCATAGREK